MFLLVGRGESAKEDCRGLLSGRGVGLSGASGEEALFLPGQTLISRAPKSYYRQVPLLSPDWLNALSPMLATLLEALPGSFEGVSAACRAFSIRIYQ